MIARTLAQASAVIRGEGLFMPILLIVMIYYIKTQKRALTINALQRRKGALPGCGNR